MSYFLSIPLLNGVSDWWCVGGEAALVAKIGSLDDCLYYIS